MNPDLSGAATPFPTQKYLTTDDVYNILRNEILNLRIKPGELLSENHVAARFNLSRTPVRSVFVMLARDGLIQLQGRKGTFVSLIDLELAEHVIYMRIQAETAVMRYIIHHPDSLLFERLERNLEQQRLIASGKLPDTFYQVDSDFHVMCMESANKLRLWQIIQSLDVHYARYRRLDYYFFQRENVYEELYRQHARLLEIMRNKEADQLYHAVTAHLYSGMIRIGNDLYNNYADYFAPSSRTISDILLDIRQQLNESLL